MQKRWYAAREPGTTTENIPGRTDMIDNHTGGKVFKVNPLEQLHRFLIIGSVGGTYYVGQQQLTAETTALIKNLVSGDAGPYAEDVLEMAASVSERGAAPKNDYALYVLALGLSNEDGFVRRCAEAMFDRIVRIPTHLFMLIDMYKSLGGGWGRRFRRTIASYYLQKDTKKLAYHVIKYRSRIGWTHQDVLRLCHAKPITASQNVLFRYIAKPDDEEAVYAAREMFPIIDGFRAVQFENIKPVHISQFITQARLPWEAIPNYQFNTPNTWDALATHMPMGATIRNLNKMSGEHGPLKPFSQFEDQMAKRLTNQNNISTARIHPLKVLVAHRAYNKGVGRHGTWKVSPKIVGALDKAFDMAFENIKPTGKNILIALDVSGSMTWEQVPGMTMMPLELGAAMCVLFARTEPNVYCVAFSQRLQNLPITAKSTLTEVNDMVSYLDFSSTNMGLAIQHAIDERLDVDAFIMITDSEVNSGRHVTQTMQQYRTTFNKLDCKLIVVAMTATECTVADPTNPKNELDVVGFDTATPQIVCDFIRGDV